MTLLLQPKRPFRRILPALLAVALLAGCASTAQRERSIAEMANSIQQMETPSARTTVVGDEQPEVLERLSPSLYPGNDRQVRLPARGPQVNLQGDAVTLRFQDAPVSDVVHALLGDLLQADYSIVGPIEGNVTLHTHSPVPRDQVLGVLESLLTARGIVMVPDINGRYQVGMRDAVDSTVPVPSVSANLPVGYSAVVVPLQYIGAAEMAEILQPVTEQGNIFRVDTVRNLLILAGTRTQIEGWMELVGMFDVDYLKGMSIGLFPLEYAPIEEVEAALRTLFSSGGSGAPGAAAAPGQRRGGGAAAAAPAGGQGGGAAAAQPSQAVEAPGSLAGLARVLPIVRLNALLIITSRAHYLEQARVWIERLDRPIEGGAEPQLFVYPVQNGSAVHLASLLAGVYGGSGAVGGDNFSARRSTDSGVAPGLASGRTGSGFGNSSGTGLRSSGSSFGAGSSNRSGSSFQSGGGGLDGGSGGMSQIELAEGVRVVADEHNNALLIFAPRKDYRTIEAALRQLDVVPMQVLIEASILEVTLNDELRYGLQWFFQNNFSSGRTGLGQLTSGDGAIGPASTGFSYSLTNSAGNIRAVLHALAEKNLLNVISTPSIMVQDNHTAQIQVGDQQPIRSAETLSEDGALRTSSVQYKDTGVMLEVAPSVNAGGLVSMLVSQSVTDVGPIDPATEQRSFLQRELSTRVAVRSGETLVLGGLIKDNSSRSRQGIPLLHDLPVVGHLFGSTAITSQRTELLILITPRVIRGESDLREVGAEIRGRMRAIQGLVERSQQQEAQRAAKEASAETGGASRSQQTEGETE